MASSSSERDRLALFHPMAPSSFPPSSKPKAVRNGPLKPKPATLDPEFYTLAGRLVGHTNPTHPPTPTSSPPAPLAPTPATLSGDGAGSGEGAQARDVADPSGREREGSIGPGCSIDGGDAKEGGEAGGVENGTRGEGGSGYFESSEGESPMGVPTSEEGGRSVSRQLSMRNIDKHRSGSFMWEETREKHQTLLSGEGNRGDKEDKKGGGQ